MVEEKTKYTGEIVKHVDEAELKDIIRKLKEEKVEAVAVCFINSYAKPENEKKAAEICQRELGDVFVTLAGGGAGVGRPEERDPAMVAEDVHNELVSLKMAEEVYKVALKPGTFEVDEAATRKLRESV